MIPGIGFFYSGFLQRKNALSMVYLSTVAFMAVTLQWFFWGYSLVYSETGGNIFGDMRKSTRTTDVNFAYSSHLQDILA
jgi:Amt family ammonium transporter